MVPPERSARRPIDPAALAQVLRRLQRAPSAPWLHGEVARRMAERLAVIRLQPGIVIDWGAFLGTSRALLIAAYPQRRWAERPAVVITEVELGAGQGQLLWSNMGLHGAVDPQAVMAAWHRSLQPGGFLMFSTLGPGSLEGLRSLYGARGWPPPHAPFVDMHDLGDMLVAAGFADPVMDQETVTLTWPSGAALLTELRQLGANVDPRRFAGLRTPRWRRRLAEALEAQAGADGRPRLAFEVVYGHAFRVAPRPRVAAETAVAVDDMRAMVRAGRRRT